ncbi:MAG: hypothetical protein L0Y71_06405 [Gemmataceae bacterium]|nr:hypothetical protein [Gemmataceae bacterium]
MSWRRLLWLCVSALLAWWLYLMLPPRPAWVLMPPQVPLYFAPTRIVTAALAAEAGDKLPWIEFGPLSRNVIAGPICVRDIATGNVVGTALAGGEVCLTLEMSADLRYLVGAAADRQSFFVHDLLTGQRWRPSDDAQLQLAPRGSLIWAASGAAHGLYDAETKRCLLDVGARYELLQFAGDDSWALFFATQGAGTETLLWRRDKADTLRATIPGVIMQWRLAGDNRTLVAQCVDPPRVIVWDVLAGEKRREAALSFRRDDLGIALSGDGSALAVWSLSNRGLDLVDVESGRVASAPSASVGGFCGFSRDGRRFAFQEWGGKRDLAVLDTSSAQVSWHEAAASQYAWVTDGSNLLITETTASLRNGSTGVEIGTRPRGVLSDDSRCLISHDIVSLLEAHDLPERLGRWLPFLTVKDQMRIRVTDVDSGHEHFRFLRKTSSKPDDRAVRWPYVTRDRFVMLTPDGVTEVWDLPPARRWGWILGPPTAVAAIPYVWRLGRRGAAKGTSAAPLNNA